MPYSVLGAVKLSAHITSQQGPHTLEPAATEPPAPTSSIGPTTSMSAQVARAGTWGLGGRAVLLLANLAATPFTIRLLGPSAYGLWALVQAILLWASVAQGGMWVATTKYGAESYALGDADGEAKVIWSGICFVLVATSVVALALGFGAYGILDLLNVKGSALASGAWALRIAGASFVLSLLVGPVITAQEVRLRWKQYTILNVAQNLLIAIGIPLGIYLFAGGVVTAAVVTLVASLLYLIGLVRDAVRLQPSLLHPRVDRATLHKLTTYGGAMAVAGLAGIPLSTGERLFLGANTSTTAVAYYAVAMTIATTLLVLPEQLCSPLIPALARLEAEGKRSEERELYAKTLAGLFLVLTPAAIVVALLAKPFLTLWAGPIYGRHATALLLVALLGVWANALCGAPRSYLRASGNTKAIALLQLAELPPYLAAAWVATAKWGALGAATVWSTRFFLDAVAHFALVRRLSHLPLTLLSHKRALSVAAPACFAVAAVGITTVSSSLVPRGAMAAALVVVYAAAVWWLVLSAKEKSGVARLAREALGAK